MSLSEQPRDSETRLDRILRKHAESLDGIVMPTEALRISMYTAMQAGLVRLSDTETPQGKINAHAAAFAHFSNEVMPPQIVASYMAEQCQAEELPPLDSVHVLLPPWTDDAHVQFSNTEERRGVVKFTKAEILAYLEWTREHPECIVGILYVQQFLGTYLEKLQSHLSPDEDFELFRQHWARSTNFQPMIGHALFHVTQENPDLPISQETIVAAMDFLAAIDAFTIRINAKAAFADRVPSLAFHCPAQGILRALLCQEELLSQLIARVSRSEVQMDISAACQVIKAQANILRDLVSEAGYFGYSLMYSAAEGFRLPND